jgi:lipopolysaccharide/colanic/teichoic acid biosynthesis glycosyltransferase
MPFIVERYDQWQRKRLDVKPGITGLWQILGRKELPLHENLEFDFFYIRNQSLLLDLTILMKTIPLVITGKGAF